MSSSIETEMRNEMQANKSVKDLVKELDVKIRKARGAETSIWELCSIGIIDVTTRGEMVRKIQVYQKGLRDALEIISP